MLSSRDWCIDETCGVINRAKPSFALIFTNFLTQQGREGFIYRYTEREQTLSQNYQSRQQFARNSELKTRWIDNSHFATLQRLIFSSLPAGWFEKLVILTSYLRCTIYPIRATLFYCIVRRTLSPSITSLFPQKSQNPYSLSLFCVNSEYQYHVFQIIQDLRQLLLSKNTYKLLFADRFATKK